MNTIQTFNEYQLKAERTANQALPHQSRILVATLGLCGESGEFADHIKKVCGHGHPPNHDQLKKELGDVLWYIAELCTIYGWEMGDIAHTNIAKLYNRYPERFSSEKSINRVDK